MKNIYLFFIGFSLLAICPASLINAQGGVSVNTAGTPPDSSALFDVSGVNKGLLMPRMTTAQRNVIASPAKGLTIFNTDCNVYNYNAGTAENPNWATVNASNAIVAGVSISANPAGAICSGNSVTFIATPAGGINSPDYQWQVNGNNVGTNSSIYTTTGLNNGDAVTCILSSNEACVTGSPATSNSIIISLTTIPSTPGSVLGSATVCGNTGGNIYSISPVAGATSYTWSVPGGATITAGAGSDSITVTFGINSGNISVLASNSCGSSAASSLAITVNPPVPATPGAISGSTSVDTGSTGNVYSISPVNYATTYTWTVPAGSTITAGQGTTSITVTFGADSGNISVTAGNSCGTSSASSLAISVVTCPYVPNSQTFNYTGNQQTFIVPCGVTSITIQCRGAQGYRLYGGLGGYATGNLSITPGQELYIYVGSQSGYNGGGSGQDGYYGGGASDVRQGGTGLNNRVIVAGGGGASYGDDGPGYAGGAGGGLNGNAAVWANNEADVPQGGTQNAGGNWGGAFGQGANSDPGYSGGGGGGGWYGGGSNNTQQGAPIMNSAGGGGSGYIGGVTGGSMQTGVQSGNGQVVFTW